MFSSSPAGTAVAPKEASLAPATDSLVSASLDAHDGDAWDSSVATTAMAVSALVLSEQHGGKLEEIEEGSQIDSAYQGDLSELLIGSMHWIAQRQRHDGGWGVPGEQPSSLATTLLVRATFQLTGLPVAYPDLAERMNGFIESQGGIEALTLQAGPASNTSLLVRGCYSLAEVVDWKQLPAIPIESAEFSQRPAHSGFWASRGVWLPAVAALGLASFELHPPRNPLTRWRRAGAVQRTLDWLGESQATDGGFEGSIPVTSSVIISLACIGQTSTPIVRRGVEFLFAAVAGDGSWRGKTCGASDET